MVGRVVGKGEGVVRRREFFSRWYISRYRIMRMREFILDGLDFFRCDVKLFVERE